jgi:hypothetical protein
MVVSGGEFVKGWIEVALVIAVAVMAVLILGPLVGAVELGIIAALVAIGIGIVMIVRRARRRSQTAP